MTDWRNLTDTQLKSAEFRGATLQALKDIDRRLSRIEGNNDNKQLITFFISGITGLISGLIGGGVSK